MAIVAADIHKHLSGGAANADVNASLGGVMSSVVVTDNTLHNLFDAVSGLEHAGGDTEYRCIYIQNAHGSLTYEEAVVFIQTNTPSAESDIFIGLDPAGLNATATTIATEQDVPAAVSFSQPTSGSPLSIGNMAVGAYIGLWIERVIAVGTSTVSADSVVLRASGGTAP